MPETMGNNWQRIETAPKDGTVVRIKGRRFHTGTRFTALAVYTKRKCPRVVAEGWFPPTKHDGQGPFEDPTHWRPEDAPDV